MEVAFQVEAEGGSGDVKGDGDDDGSGHFEEAEVVSLWLCMSRLMETHGIWWVSVRRVFGVYWDSSTPSTGVPFVTKHGFGIATVVNPIQFHETNVPSMSFSACT